MAIEIEPVRRRLRLIEHDPEKWEPVFRPGRRFAKQRRRGRKRGGSKYQ
jgi:hypothetical protein